MQIQGLGYQFATHACCRQRKPGEVESGPERKQKHRGYWANDQVQAQGKQEGVGRAGWLQAVLGLAGRQYSYGPPHRFYLHGLCCSASILLTSTCSFSCWTAAGKVSSFVADSSILGHFCGLISLLSTCKSWFS